MRKIILGIVILLTLSCAPAFSQLSAPPKEAIDITATDIKAVQSSGTPGTNFDRQLRVVDMGKYNLAVGVIHRGPTTNSPDGPIGGPAHTNTAETYYILSGSGTLVTGGTLIDPKPMADDNEAVKVLNGPTINGTVTDGYKRKVSPGDVIIIPPGVFHSWTGIADHVDYLSVRPDPDHVLPSGYVNPALKKQ